MKKIKTPEEFSWKYDAHLQPSTRMTRRHRKLDYTAFTENGPELWNRIPYTDVPCVEIHMPEDRFRALMEDLNWIHDIIERSGFSGQAASAITDREAEEHRLRAEYPALELAYNKYLTLLRLCGGSR